MKLSERLARVADEIRQGETVADIGAGHGFLPVCLLRSGKSPKVIVTDISEKALKIAEANVRSLVSAGSVGSYEFRLGSGLEVLEKGEADTAVFSGMGGRLISGLLDKDMDKTRSIKRFVFQPRNKSGVLRLWLARNGIRIVKESLVRENGFICEILTAETGYEENKDISWNAKFDYPDMLINEENSLIQEYLEHKLKYEEGIYNNILKGRNVSRNKIKNCTERILQLRFLIEEREKTNFIRR